MSTRSLISPPEMADIRQTHDARLLFILAWSWLIAVTITVPVMMAVSPSFLNRGIGTILAVDALCVVCLLLNGRGLTRIASFVLALGLLSIATLMALTAGGLGSPSFIAYLPIILTSGFLLGSRWGGAVAGLCILTGLTFVILETYGLLPESWVVHTPFTFWLGYLISASLIVVLQFLAIHHSKIALRSVAEELEKRRKIEATLREAEERYEDLVESAQDAIFTLSNDGKITFLNRAFEALLGWKRDDWLGRSFIDIIHPDDISAANERFRNATQGIAVLPNELRVKTSAGEYATGEFVITPQVRDGKIVSIVGIARDVTQRRKLEEELELLKNSIDLHYDGAYWLDRNNKFVYVNHAACKALGYTREEMIGRDLSEINPNATPENVERVWERLRSVGFFTTESTHRRKDGSVFPVEIVSTYVRFAGREYNCGFARDITERRKTEDKIQSLSRAIEQSPVSVVITDVDGNIEYVNPRFVELTGYAAAEVVGKNPRILKSGETPPEVYRKLWDSIKSGGQWTGLLHNKKKNGELYWEYALISPVRSPSGSTTHYLAVKEDVTERIRAEDELRSSEKRYRSLFENMLNGYAYCKMIFENGRPQDFVYLDVNPAFETLTGLKHVVGKKVSEVIPGIRESDPILLEVYGRVASTGRPERVENYVEPLGIWFSISVFSPTKDHFVAIFDNITERRNADAAIRKSEEKYRNFFEEDITGDFVTTPSGKILSCNPSFARIFGFRDVDEAMSVNVSTLYPSPERRQTFITRLKAERKVEYHDMEMRRRDGKILNILANIFGSFNEQGELTEIKGYLLDDTERRTLEQQLIQSQKLESLGTLAGGIAHDFNNILGIIMGHATLLEGIKDDPAIFARSIEAVVKAAERGASLVQQLLTFARKSDVILQPVELNEICKEIEKLLRQTFPRTITITTSLQENLPAIVADSTQMHQVFLNLCVNARDAMPKGGTLSIATKKVDREAVLARFATADARQYVEITVRDTGIGMNEATRERIFEPFFTTKGIGKGTGLGLSLVFGIIKGHNGFIEVQSKPDKGTSFQVYLPVEEIAPEIAKPKPKSIAELPGGNETVLLVEDEELLRGLVKATLVSKGYSVLVAEDGVQGLDLYRKHQKEIAVVVSDVGLPLMSGDEMFKKIKAFNPDAKVVLASGFIDPDLKSEIFKLGAAHFVQKPYSHSEILLKIREALDT